MTGSTLVLVHYDQIPGLAQLQRLGQGILGFAFVLGLALELYRLLTRGTADFVGPIVKVGLAMAVLQSLPTIGLALGGMSESVSRSMLEVSEVQLFGEAFTHAVGQVYQQSAWDAVSAMFSLRGVLVLFASLLYLAMMIIKLVVIDVLWPLAFSLVLVLGCLAIPLGLLPGASVQGWTRTLLEVALWPVVFQILVALMVGSFKALLGQVVALDTAQVFAAGLTVDADAQATAALSQGALVLLRFWALCIGYCLLGLATPVLAGLALRSGPVTAAFGAATSAVGWGMSLARAGGQARSGAAGASTSAATHGATTSGGLGERLAHAAERTHTEARELRGLAWEANQMDQRQYPEPRKGGAQ